MDQAVICVHCGRETQNSMNNMNNMNYMNSAPFAEEKATGGMIALSILFPIVGIILGVVKKNEGKTKAGNTYLKCGLISWGASFLISMLLSACMPLMLSSM